MEETKVNKYLISRLRFTSDTTQTGSHCRCHCSRDTGCPSTQLLVCVKSVVRVYMFERLLAPVILRLLRDYVKSESFEEKDIEANVWSGYIALSNLELRPDAFAALGLPFALRRGTVGRVEIGIPWGNLGSRPSLVSFDDVFLLFETDYSPADAQARARHAQREKMTHVVAAEAAAKAAVVALEKLRNARATLRAASLSAARLRVTSATGGAIFTARAALADIELAIETDANDDDESIVLEDIEAMGGIREVLSSRARAGAPRVVASPLLETLFPGVVEHVVAKIIEKLQVNVRNLHIRWEDRASLGRQPFTRPFALGVCIEALCFMSESAGGVSGGAGAGVAHDGELSETGGCAGGSVGVGSAGFSPPTGTPARSRSVLGSVLSSALKLMSGGGGGAGPSDALSEGSGGGGGGDRGGGALQETLLYIYHRLARKSTSFT